MVSRTCEGGCSRCLRFAVFRFIFSERRGATLFSFIAVFQLRLSGMDGPRLKLWRFHLREECRRTPWFKHEFNTVGGWWLVMMRASVCGYSLPTPTPTPTPMPPLPPRTWSDFPRQIPHQQTRAQLRGSQLRVFSTIGFHTHERRRHHAFPHRLLDALYPTPDPPRDSSFDGTGQSGRHQF